MEVKQVPNKETHEIRGSVLEIGSTRNMCDVARETERLRRTDVESWSYRVGSIIMMSACIKDDREKIKANVQCERLRQRSQIG